MEITITQSEAETFALGKSIGEAAQPGSVFCVSGDLGSGKTVLAKGMAEGLGISGDIVSPTFTLVQEYQGRLPFYHFDIYRLTDEEALLDIGWEEYMDAGGVCLVEWADQVPEAMPPEAEWITFERDLTQGPEYRRITRGHRGEKC